MSIPDWCGENRDDERARLEGQSDSLHEEIAELKRQLAEADEERPFWLLHALLDFAALHPCARSEEHPCAQTDDCVTEWCAPCAARAWVAKEKERSDAVVDRAMGTIRALADDEKGGET